MKHKRVTMLLNNLQGFKHNLPLLLPPKHSEKRESYASTSFSLLVGLSYSMASRSSPSISMPHNSHTKPPPPPPPPRRTCLCSPTTHPGSFRCSMHKKPHRAAPSHVPRNPSIKNNTHRWESSISAKAYSLKAFLLQVIKPSSHDLHRRKNFQPKPTRFCLMNGSRDAVAVS